MLGANGKVRVEPRKVQNGAFKWKVTVDGIRSSSHNYKDTAVKKARSKARANDAKLEVLDKNMNVTRTADHR